MDDLSTLLHAVRLRGGMYCSLEARAPWAMCAPPSPVATFHGVLRGDAVLQIPGEDDVTLAEGDLVVLCHGSGHAIGDAPGRVATPIHTVVGASTEWPVRCGGGGDLTVLICGSFSVKGDGPPLLALMPPVLRLRRNARVASLLTLLAAEGSARAPGAGAFIARVTEALFVEVAREWGVRSDGIAALCDARVAAALAAIHKEPTREWTVGTLARDVGMSRSAFALVFTQLVGATPLAYVQRWRLYMAKVMLRESAHGIAQIAEDVGYDSEASLGKAFKRYFGLPPGAYRRAARTQAETSQR